MHLQARRKLGASSSSTRHQRADGRAGLSYMIDEEVVPIATLGPYKRMSAHRRFGRAVKVSPRYSLLIQMMSWPENVHERFEVFQRGGGESVHSMHIQERSFQNRAWQNIAGFILLSLSCCLIC
jgi:hypothetical protein